MFFKPYKIDNKVNKWKEKKIIINAHFFLTCFCDLHTLLNQLFYFRKYTNLYTNLAKLKKKKKDKIKI